MQLKLPLEGAMPQECTSEGWLGKCISVCIQGQMSLGKAFCIIPSREKAFTGQLNLVSLVAWLC